MIYKDDIFGGLLGGSNYRFRSPGEIRDALTKAQDEAVANSIRSHDEAFANSMRDHFADSSRWYSGSISTSTSSTSSGLITYGDSASYMTIAARSEPKPESNMAWLDRRVDEMRVRV